MARLLALEWDAREARIAVGRTRGTEVVVEHAFAVDLGQRNASQPDADKTVGQRIADALAARQIGRADTLVALGRASIELRQLTLPPAPPEELPDLVRFQALRQFTTINETWTIDFVRVGGGEKESTNVIAAAISPDLVDQIRQTCLAGSLTPKRLVLRPFAAASLLRRHDRSRQASCRLMVDMLGEEADLTVMVDESVALMRTVRISATSDAAAQSRALLGEIRRTIAAGQNQLSGRRVERVVLCGDGSDHASLKSLIETELTYEVDLFDPFQAMTLGGDLQAQRPEHSGRFAPLLGMLLDEAAGAAHAIDFLHPRQKPAPPNQLRRSLLIAATVAVACAAVVFGVIMRLNSLDSDIQVLTVTSKGLDDAVSRAKLQRAEVGLVEEFLASDYVWLDELYALSDELPDADHVKLDSLNMITRTPSGGQMILDGYTREAADIEQLQRPLRREGRRVLSKGGQYDQRREKYNWHFKETVVIEPLVVEAPDSAKSPAEAEAETPPAAALESAATPASQGNPS